jgi:assimilatory nitrate reductase catalytic subunit
MTGGRLAPEAGPMVCACSGVGPSALHDAMAAGKGADAEAIGIALRAGTNCGTCVPELRSIVARETSHSEERQHERTRAHAK